MTKRKYPLNIHITSLFLFLVLILGGGLIALSYLYSQQLFSHIARNTSYENSQKLEYQFQKEISPIITTLDLMATRTLPMQPVSNKDEHDWLKSMQQVFDKNPNLTAIFYGSTDGTSTQFRPLRDRQTREHFGAGHNSEIMLNYTNMQGRSDLLFYDKDLRITEIHSGATNRFDPRIRPWYLNARFDGEIRMTNPYLFYYLDVTGITLSRMSIDGETVVAADLTLQHLSDRLSNMAFSRHSKLALFDAHFQLLAAHQLNADAEAPTSQKEKAVMNSIFSIILNRNSSNIIYEQVDYQGEEWSVTLTPVNLTKNVRLFLAEAVPSADLLENLTSVRNNQIYSALVLLLICFILIWQIGEKITAPLNALITLTENIRNFQFKKTRYPKSVIKEVNSLTHSIQLMEHTLHDLLSLLRDTASNHEFCDLAKTISKQSYLITRAETIMLYMLDDKKGHFTVAANHAIIPLKININQLIDDTPWFRASLSKGESIHINKGDNIIQKHRDIFYNSDLYLFPLLNRNEQLVGILALGYERPIEKNQRDKHAFLQELLSFAGISKDNIDLMQQQKNMLNAFIELIASAIDTKSPYTGLHCQRVPFIAERLTRAAAEDKKYFPEFSMDKKQWEELNFAAWLHDCGKITTPEYVVDKATKLETIHNRIHEIRMRFEVLKAQEEIRYWQKVSAGGDKTALKQELDTQLSTLDEEFAFVAKCNTGEQTFTAEDKTRLLQIAQRTWTRTLDSTLGTSWLEKQREKSVAETPAEEPLLADKSGHMVPWEESIDPNSVWSDEFNLHPGQLQYNRGELYNLMVTNGTLTDEERFMINNHIVQTIYMLERLPYPAHLKNVPDIAGNHHERIDGKGYPRGLTKDQLTVQEKVMVIADVFEALTSNDRPYKKAHSLDAALNIMTDMATSGHIDPELYLLFLENRVDHEYTAHFLNNEQQSDQDRDAHIRKVKVYLSDYI